MALSRLIGSVTGHLLSEFDDNAVVDDTVNSSSGGHGVLENLIPLREDKIGSNDDAVTLIAFSEQGKKDFHFVTRLLNITDVVEDKNFKAI